MATVEELEIRFKAEINEVKTKLSTLQRHLKDTNSTTQKLQNTFRQMRDVMQGPVAAFNMVVGVITKVVGTFDKLIMGAAEAEAAMSNLKTTLAATGSALNFSELIQSADALSKITLFEDEQITQAQALLVTFKNIGTKVFPDVVKSAMDMSTVLGIDLSTASKTLGKALDDPIRGLTQLRRYGVQLSAAQEDQVRGFIKVNDVASAQALILKELSTKFGGASEAVANTATGQYQQMKKAIGELNEEVGKLAAVNFKDLNKNLAEMANKSADALAKARAKKLGMSEGDWGGIAQALKGDVNKISEDALRAMGIPSPEDITAYLKQNESKYIKAMAWINKRKEVYGAERARAQLSSGEQVDLGNYETALKMLEVSNKLLSIDTERNEKAKKQIAYEKWLADEMVKRERAEDAAFSVYSAAMDRMAEYTKAQEALNKKTSENTKISIDEAANAWEKYYTAAGEGNAEKAADGLSNIIDKLVTEIGSIFESTFKSAFLSLGQALVEGEEGWKSFARAGIEGVAAIVEALALKLGIMAVDFAIALDAPRAIAAGIGAAAALTAAGAIRAIPLAEGGIVPARSGGTLALLGEGGRDEAVVPLGRGGFGTTIIHVHGSVVSERQLMALGAAGSRRSGRRF
jgi:hypothetical protein